NTYGKPPVGSHSLDCLCVDEKGGKYLVDVKSMYKSRRPTPLSKRELETALLAKSKGFRVLVPVVVFLEDWNVRIELREL
ncbi:MAG: hypothetical protein ACP5KA_07440, partial [Desulfurococcaceae archaeon]